MSDLFSKFRKLLDSCGFLKYSGTHLVTMITLLLCVVFLEFGLLAVRSSSCRMASILNCFQKLAQVCSNYGNVGCY